MDDITYKSLNKQLGTMARENDTLRQENKRLVDLVEAEQTMQTIKYNRIQELLAENKRLEGELGKERGRNLLKSQGMIDSLQIHLTVLEAPKDDNVLIRTTQFIGILIDEQNALKAEVAKARLDLIYANNDNRWLKAELEEARLLLEDVLIYFLDADRGHTNMQVRRMLMKRLEDWNSGIANKSTCEERLENQRATMRKAQEWARKKIAELKQANERVAEMREAYVPLVELAADNIAKDERIKELEGAVNAWQAFRELAKEELQNVPGSAKMARVYHTAILLTDAALQKE